MSEQNNSVVSQIIGQFTSPWDWVAGAAGALGGLGITIATGGADLGTSAAAGATAGVTARKAIAASFYGRRLKRQAEGLRRQIEKHISEVPKLAEVSIRLDAELNLWVDGATKNEDFEKQLYALLEEYRKLLSERAKEIKLLT